MTGTPDIMIIKKEDIPFFGQLFQSYIREAAKEAAQEAMQTVNDPLAAQPMQAQASHWAGLRNQHERTFKRWAKQNGIKGIRQGGKLYFWKEQARAFFEKEY